MYDYFKLHYTSCKHIKGTVKLTFERFSINVHSWPPSVKKKVPPLPLLRSPLEIVCFEEGVWSLV